ncbi:5-oxoprolinase subunit PxpB [Aureimonas jatrophae]|uniref:Sensor histidine kinase inhibitor, KipI family n=1 Tax=Aureimonas jatrophae TaxID=1166073 RepID=A0A1H0HGQ6_9HYPH|nr:5-oxoprolinase subunit PxpB [Aureimonas jatrophae]MBB3950583.1 KipI family sensor histidine kinase inhibitor [Aureimonas jatrophae]SDO18352.1 sensor histidine kinase inhibitor, KipI family [Aureimonas jatrophae]
MTASETSATGLRILPLRAGAALVELPDLDATLRLLAALRARPVAGVHELLPAARTLLVGFDDAALSLDALAAMLRERRTAEADADGAGRLVEIPVVYDGEDLGEVARLTGLAVEEVVRAHRAATYTVAFTGFAPGFGYLTGGDPRLAVPRRASPRTRVPAGALGLAGPFSGVYPKASPGGWQLIGRTPLALFDLAREPAALLQPGDRVRFRELRDMPAVSQRGPAPRAAPPPGAAVLEVLGLGLPVLVQDLGRPGLAAQGVGRSGASDRASLALANRRVGNPAGAPALEVTLGGLRLRAHGRLTIGLAGARAPLDIRARDGSIVDALPGRAIALEDGDTLAIGAPDAGLRTYLALRGGIEVPLVLGSAARDTLAEIGPEPLRVGDRLPAGRMRPLSPVALDEPEPFALPRAGACVTLDVALGPRADWFTPDALVRFLAQAWRVSAQASRVGLRLEGEPLERRVSAELPSEATLFGSVQVPPGGQPVLFLADHPLTGGYPVIATLLAHHLDLTGQIPPGARIRFRAAQDFAPLLVPGDEP